MALHHKTDENLYRLNRCNYKSMHVTTDVLQRIHRSLNKEKCGESGTENDNDFFLLKVIFI